MFSKFLTNESVHVQIRFLLLQNRQGKTRLSKWYVPYEDSEKQTIQVECHKIVTQREAKFTNFVEWRNHKLVYR
jgi:AP-2 complex subunit sigma-1